MKRKAKSKIATDHEGALSQANPFAEINLENLPDGQESKPESDSIITGNKKVGAKGRVEVTREKSGRAGKIVTVLREFSATISSGELNAIAFELKKQCACGGSLKGRKIELQGDVCKQAMIDLKKRGFMPVRCGY